MSESEEDFRTLYFGEARSGKTYQLVYEAWLEYYRACDAFDRLVCSGRSPRSGEPFPADARERWLSSRFALKQKEVVERRLYGIRVSAEVARRAQRAACDDSEKRGR